LTTGKYDEYQAHVRSMLEDLQATLSASNNRWTAWELEFIEDISTRLKGKFIDLSPKQYEKVHDLWDKI
jgi:hypothetical protein